MMKLLLLLIALMMLIGCQDTYGTATATPEPSTTPFLTAAPTNTGVFIETLTGTVTPTLPSPTIWPGAETPGFQTPTPITGGTSGGIIEVTPLPEPPSRSGEKWTDLLEGSFYKPTCSTYQNVRNATNLEATVVRVLACNVEVPVYVMIELLASRDLWLCLDAAHDQAGVFIGSDCHEVAAFFIGPKQFGELSYP